MVATLSRLDAVPTEAQMKLLIGQTLSLPFAYNSPVIVLNFEVDDNGNIAGRFKDANRPRVFEFEMDGESVNFKPFNPNRMDSSEIDVEEWEEFSDGYSFRVDAAKSGKKAQCVKPTSYNCGSVCINVKKNCKSSPSDNTSKQRLKKLNDIAKDYTKQRIKLEQKGITEGEEYNEADKKGGEAGMLAVKLLGEKMSQKEKAKVEAKAKKEARASDKPKPSKDELEKSIKDPKFKFNDDEDVPAETANDLLKILRSKLNNQGQSQSEPKKPKIASYKDFQKDADEVIKQLDKDYNYDNLVPIHRIRKEFGDRVSREKFNEYMIEMQANDEIQLIGGQMTDATLEQVEDSIKTSLGGMRYYAKRLKK